MTFFCPIFPKQHRLKAKEYEDSNHFSFDGGGRNLYVSRSMSALNFVPLEEDNKLRPTSADSHASRLIMVNTDFDPTVDDELRVRKEDIVTVMYRDRQWMYVVRKNDRGESEEGFIPVIYCQELDLNKLRCRHQKNPRLSVFKKSPLNNSNGKRNYESGNKKLEDSAEETVNPAESSSEVAATGNCVPNRRVTLGSKSLMNVDLFLRSLEENKKIGANVQWKNESSVDAIENDAIGDQAGNIMYGLIEVFSKRPLGRYIAEFDFAAQHADDADISEGDVLLLLNNDDPDWFWIKRKDGSEGFVPSSYIRRVNEDASVQKNEELSRPKTITTGEIPFNELIVAADFEPEAADDLRVTKGDWIYGYQMPHQVPGWLWAYSARTKRYGFVPSSVVRMPVTSVL